MTTPEGDAERTRRVRYGGTHPRRTEDKYKELRGDPEAVARAEARGHTPAGRHRPIMLAEVIAALAPQPGEVLVDCTLGFGGHAEALARAIQPGGRVIALDLDTDMLPRTTARLGSLGLRVTTHAMNFAGLPKVLATEGVTHVDGLLADLGVSSMQLDTGERGFSLKHDGPIDMRMDRSRGKPAAEWLRGQSAEGLAEILFELGEEPAADRVASAIALAFQRRSPPTRTRELVAIVLSALGIDPKRREASAFQAHPAARTFQAIRMAVNREVENLQALLRSLPGLLNPGGRVAILTFHSGEERLVRKALKESLVAGTFGTVQVEGLRATREEVGQNPRARSARLFSANCCEHVAIRSSEG